MKAGSLRHGLGRAIAFVLAVSLWYPVASAAASFDCKKAATQVEKAVCGDPQISALDDAMAAGYTSASQMLSDDGRKLLREGQRRWLRYVKSVCFEYKNDQGGPTCTKKLYQARIKDLDGAARRLGPFVFGRIDYFFSQPDDSFGRPFQGQTAYPRIDQPMSQVARQWNAAMAPEAQAQGAGFCDGSPGDVNIDFTILSATEKAISVQTTGWTYCHGTPHGQGETKGVMYVLTPGLHRLTESELFRGDSSWKDFLTEKAYEVLAKKDSKVDRKIIRDDVTAIDAWSLTADALVITVDPYETLAYAYGTTVIPIPWTELRPFLAPNAPFPSQR